MKKRVFIVILAALIGCLGMLAALHYLHTTPSVIAGKTVSKMQSLQSVTGELTADYDGSISFMGLSTDIGIDVGMDVEMLTGENMRSHETGTVTVSLLGFSYPVALENYAQQDANVLTSYTNLQKSKWLRHQKTGAEGQEAQSIDSVKFILGMMQKIMKGEIEAEAAKETEMLDGKEVRRMDVSISGPLLQEFVVSAAQSSDFALPEDLDLSEASADITVYVDEATGRPAEFRIDCTALGNVIIKHMTGDQKWNGETHSFLLTFRFKEFDTLESLEIPADVAENAIDVENLNILEEILGK